MLSARRGKKPGWQGGELFGRGAEGRDSGGANPAERLGDNECLKQERFESILPCPPKPLKVTH